jgi:hypothetical protein
VTSVKLAVSFVARVAKHNPGAVQPVLDALQAWLVDPSDANLALVREAGRKARTADAARQAERQAQCELIRGLIPAPILRGFND